MVLENFHGFADVHRTTNCRPSRVRQKARPNHSARIWSEPRHHSECDCRGCVRERFRRRQWRRQL